MKNCTEQPKHLLLVHVPGWLDPSLIKSICFVHYENAWKKLSHRPTLLQNDWYVPQLPTWGCLSHGSQLASPPCTDLLPVSFFEPAPAVITWHGPKAPTLHSCWTIKWHWRTLSWIILNLYIYRYRFYTECYRSFHQIEILKPKLAATCTPWLTLSYRLGGNCRLRRLWHWLFRGRSTGRAWSTFVPVFRDLVRAIKVSVLCLKFLGQWPQRLDTLLATHKLVT